MQSESSELHAELRHCDQLRRAESTLASRLAESRRTGDHMETQAMKALGGAAREVLVAGRGWVSGEVGWWVGDVLLLLFLVCLGV